MGKATCTYGLSYEVAKVSVAFTEETDSYSLLAASCSVPALVDVSGVGALHQLGFLN